MMCTGPGPAPHCHFIDAKELNNVTIVTSHKAGQLSIHRAVPVQRREEMSKSYEEINAKIEQGDAVVLTADEFKQVV